MNIVDVARKYVGKQETMGSNRGALVDQWKKAVSAGLESQPIPWCGCFVFAMLTETSGLDKKGLAKALGFDTATWYPESTRSWLEQARAAERITSTPVEGDLFLMLKRGPDGAYLKDFSHHVGFLAQDGCPAVGEKMQTIEGNTVPGHVEGFASREGDGVYERSRTVQRGEFVFVSIPEELKVPKKARKTAEEAA